MVYKVNDYMYEIRNDIDLLLYILKNDNLETLEYYLNYQIENKQLKSCLKGISLEDAFVIVEKSEIDTERKYEYLLNFYSFIEKKGMKYYNDSQIETLLRFFSINKKINLIKIVIENYKIYPENYPKHVVDKIKTIKNIDKF